ncbi:cytochrome P450 CYP72A219-like isoform X2 [Pistacia vera]|uniref:cytochrome P450 CYP72A219-like isoform X2 n=1 Tax=Pistacia vera TaxID=55513 RepID=UPI0012637DE7|nr:cytochrome P450 CYP72A219-like isoform X2 [Pistacia vera]
MPRVNPLLHELAISYKKTFVVWYGTTPRVAIMDPKLIKEVFSNKSGNFPKPEISLLTKLFATGLATYEGHKWSKHRKIINPAFHIEKLKQMLPAFSTCCEELIEKWDNLVTGLGGSCELDVSIEFQNFTGDVISRAAFGSSFEEGRLIFLLQKEQGKLFLQSLAYDKFPLFRFLPTKVNRRMRQIYREVRTILRGIIEKREKAILMGNTSDKEDLLDLLLKSNLNELQENQNSNAGMTTEDVFEECRLFYFAGQETTANLLTWTMIVLSMHINWQERAREEVLQILGKNKPTFDDLNHLKIVNMILHEVLRLYPPTSLLRSIVKETKLGDFCLPAGIELFMPMHLVHRDPEQWGEDATEFNPQRFSEGMSKASKDQVSYFPFGYGPRICIGQNFAMLEAKLALSQILQHFSFELSPTYTHAPSIVLTLQPQYGAQIIMHKL